MQHKNPPFLLFLLLALLLTAPAAFATVTVTVSSPANNATVPTSLNFVASATTDAAGARVTGWYIYVDSVAAWNTSGPTTSINAPVTMSAGTRSVIVRAWDSTGAFGSQTLTLTVGACSGICVTVTSPTLTESQSSPVHFTASAVDSAGHSITGYIVYEDGKDQYRNYTSTFDAQVAASGGTHNFFVRAWDSTGAFGSSATFSMTVPGTYKTVKHHDHVIVVAFENHSYESAYGGPVGNASAPYFNNTLIAKYGLTNNFYANGHDSLTQYWWMLDGTNDCGLGTADTWMQNNLGPLLASSYFQPGGDGLLIVWWDEGNLSGYTGTCASGGTDDRSTSTVCGGGGRVAIVVAAPDVVSAGFKSSTYHQHRAATRTVVEAFCLSVPSSVSGTNGLSELFP